MSATAIETAQLNVANVCFDVFLRTLSKACRFIDKAAIDETRCIHISSNGSGLSMTATNYEARYTGFVPGAADNDLSLFVDGKKLSDLLKKERSGAKIMVSESDGAGCIEVDGFTVNLKPSGVTSFGPTLEHFTALKSSNSSFVIPNKTLSDMISKVLFAVSTEETRYYLNGIFMHATHDGQLAFVATDGHRLSKFQVPLPAGAGAIPDEGVIIPRQAIVDLEVILKEKGRPDDEQTLITVTSSGASFLVGDDDLIETKLIDGTFPDYHRVIPQNNQHEMVVFPDDVIAAVKKVSAILSGKKHGVALTLAERSLTLTCTDDEFGDATTTIDVENECTLEIGISHKHLVDALKRVDGRAVFRLGDSGTPVHITDSRDDRVVFVQMPMRV